MPAERSNGAARQRSINRHSGPTVAGVGDLPESDVWKRCYVVEGTNGPIRRAYITNEIRDEIVERQETIESYGTGEWQAEFSRQLPVMHEYPERTIWMPISVRITSDNVSVGAYAGDGWSPAIDTGWDSDLYEAIGGDAWFDTTIPDITGENGRLEANAIDEVLHPDDVEPWDAFLDELAERDRL